MVHGRMVQVAVVRTVVQGNLGRVLQGAHHSPGVHTLQRMLQAGSTGIEQVVRPAIGLGTMTMHCRTV